MSIKYGKANVIQGGSSSQRYHNDSNSDLFESHSAYRKQFSQSPIAAMQYQANAFHRYGSTSNTHNLNLGLISPRIPPISSNTAMGRSNFRQSSVPVNTYNPQSEEEFIRMQRICLDRLRDTVWIAKKQLAEIEHEKLMKEEELETLKKVQGNPTQADIVALENEIRDINRSTQKLCDEMDNIEASSSKRDSKIPITKRNSNAASHTTKKPSWMSPMESPTTKLLRNSIDNSLVFSHYDSY